MKYHNTDLHLSDIPNAFLYQPNMDSYPSSVIGCFIISDGWNKQALLALKEKSGAYFLVGLQTDDHEYEGLDIIEGIVRCQSDEVQQVVKLLNISPRSSIAIDTVDIKKLFERAKAYNFSQTHITDALESDAKRRSIDQLISQFPKNFSAKGFLVGIESSEYVSLNDTTYIIEAIENSVATDDLYKYYCTSVVDEPNSFRLKAIYAEK